MVNNRRREVLQLGGVLGLAACAPGITRAFDSAKASVHTLGDSSLISLSDGYLELPRSFLFPDSINTDELESLLTASGVTGDTLQPACNVSLWQNGDRNILFDVGAGPNFMDTTGALLSSLEAASLSPDDITDVVFTHAHPDHLWGLLDDFDDLLFAEATYHMHREEWGYWLANDTMEKTPDARKGFVVGAQNRLPRIEEQVSLFEWGDEPVPNVEAMDTHGHTPGHTSFVLHQGSDAIVVIGDAVTNSVVSIERPDWPSGSDQDPDAGRLSRRALLDRLAADKLQFIGYHLPEPGLGRVERHDDAFVYLPA